MNSRNTIDVRAEKGLPFPLNIALHVPKDNKFEDRVFARDTITWDSMPPSDDD